MVNPATTVLDDRLHYIHQMSHIYIYIYKYIYVYHIILLEQQSFREFLVSPALIKDHKRFLPSSLRGGPFDTHGGGGGAL